MGTCQKDLQLQFGHQYRSSSLWGSYTWESTGDLAEKVIIIAIIISFS